MANILDVAHFFLYKQAMDNKKLQKLCYYAQAWYLAFYKTELFSDHLEAWVHGPVSPRLYGEYKQHRFNPIPQYHAEPPAISADQAIREHLIAVFETYGDFTGDELEALTHSEAPWIKARGALEEWEPSNNVIDLKDMEEYYWNVSEKGQYE